MNYICVFDFRKNTLTVPIDRIDEVSSGFWITESHFYTTGSDAKFWIPFSRIRYVEKEKAGYPPREG